MTKYYHKRCDNTFESEGPIEITECPRCHHRFGEVITKVTCTNPECKSTFYTDMEYQIGFSYPCPFCHQEGTIRPIRNILRALRKIILIGFIGTIGSGIVYALINLINWVVSILAIATLTVQKTVFNILDVVNNTITTFQNEMAKFEATIQNEIPMVIAGSIEIVKFLGVTMIVLVVFVIFLYTITIRLTRPIEELDAIAKTRAPIHVYGKKYNIPEDRPDLVLNDVVSRSNKVGLNQRRVIGFLVICVAILGLYCYLSKNTSSKPGEIAQTTLQLGTVNTIIFGIGFYGSKRFFGLDKKFMHQRKRLRGIVLSAIFGIATILTMIFLPLMLKKSLSGSVVAVELVLNMVVDVFVMSYEKIVDLLWKSPKEIYKEIIHFLRDEIPQFRLTLVRYLERIYAILLETASKIISKLTLRN